jgi:hypothetical protein
VVLGQGERESSGAVLVHRGDATGTVNVEPHPLQRRPGVAVGLLSSGDACLAVHRARERHHERREDDEQDAHRHEQLHERLPALGVESVPQGGMTCESHRRREHRHRVGAS